MSFGKFVWAIDPQEYNNLFSLNIFKERLLSMLAAEINESRMTQEELATLNNLSEEEAAIKADEDNIVQLQSQTKEINTIDNEGSNAAATESAQKTAQLADRKKSFEALKLNATSVEKKQADFVTKVDNIATQLLVMDGYDVKQLTVAHQFVAAGYVTIAENRAKDAELKQLFGPANSSKSASEFIDKLGKTIFIEYKTRNGTVQTDFSLENNNVRKVLDSCRIES